VTTSRRPPSRRWQLRRALARYRRLLAALLVAGAVTAGISAVAPAPPPTVAVVVAARDLPAGARLGPADLATARVPPQAVPDGAYAGPSPPMGRSLAAPLRRGEPVTDVRLLGPGLLAGTTGLVEVGVRLADPGSGALVAPGDLVDVLAAAPDPVGGVDAATAMATAASGEPARSGTGPAAATVAESVRVLAVPPPPGTGASSVDGVLVLLAVPPSTARALAAAQAGERLSVAVRAVAGRSG
jgi:pilus assembly protein CpaB